MYINHAVMLYPGDTLIIKTIPPLVLERPTNNNIHNKLMMHNK